MEPKYVELPNQIENFENLSPYVQPVEECIELDSDQIHSMACQKKCTPGTGA